MRVRAFVLVVLAACAPAVIAPTDWRQVPPPAPCEVEEIFTDAAGPDRRISRYTADGRLVFAQTKLTYDGSGFEHVSWDKGRVVRIDAYYETAYREGSCDVEGGCDQPASRTVESRVYGYDAAGRLTSDRSHKREYRKRGATWVDHADERGEHEYVYDGGKLVAVEHSPGRDETFAWKHGHPVARRFDGRTSTYEWSGDRLATYRWLDYVQTFEYDAAGRLVREVLASSRAGADDPTITEWTYDQDGRPSSEVTKTRTSERPTTWTYDAQGRVTSVAQDGRVNRTYAYGAGCPANVGAMPPPTAEPRANLAACIRSPGYSYRHCF